MLPLIIILLALSDFLLTWKVLSLFPDAELNPIASWAFTSFGPFGLFALKLLSTTIFFIATACTRKCYKPYLLLTASLINLVAVVMGIYSYWLTF